MRRLLLLFLSSVIIAGSIFAQDAGDSSSRLIESTKEEAIYALTLVCSLEGIFTKQERIFYFRAPKHANDFGESTTSSLNADGPGTGYGFSVYAEPRNTAATIEISAYWTTKSAHGKSELTLLVPYFAEKKGKEAGFDYVCTWKKLK